MRKILLLVTCVIISISGIAQDNTNEQIFESQLSKSALFVNAQQWSTLDLAGVTKKLETSNNETGAIFVNISALHTLSYLDYTFKYNLKIDCRDNKYRITSSTPIVYITLNSNWSNFDYLAQSTLRALHSELGAVYELSKSNFNGSDAWNIEAIQPILSKIEAGIATLKSDKDKLDVKKDKKEISLIDSQLNPLKKQALVLSGILRTWEQCTKDITASIEKTMSQKDDF